MQAKREAFSSPKELFGSPTYKRKTLLERKSRGMVSKIVVTHCVRLCRDFIHSPHTTKLMVLINKATSDEHELSQDIPAVKQGRRVTRREPHSREKTQDQDNGSSATNDNVWKLSIVRCQSKSIQIIFKSSY